MKKSMTNWPEMLFIDGTYKLFNLGCALYLIMIQNGSRRGEIVAEAIVTSETAENIKWIARNFRELNEEACKKTTCIMTDKDLTERRAFAEVFPDTRFLLCLFHTLKTFDRQLKRMKLSKEERLGSFELLRNLAYAKSQKYYDKVYQKLLSKAPNCVINYFNHNWHEIRDKWTMYAMAEFNYGNDTNNIVESANKQIKSVCNYHSTLCEFANNFFIMLKSSKLETNLLIATDGLKRLNIENELGSCVNEYADFLTRVAFNKVKEELQKYSYINMTASCTKTKVCNILIKGYRLTSSATDCS
ncbi:uncharacterized protein LOC130669843 [Microplitis mediator]|uniref:uncharacterized protein LOC130669843 n=1 Tax=Microplitis mediator TaxID=375433 RepID=UPI00255422A9|nr:uncharacterized protein LOC130669843 [Microplitis mediator]